jgi:hypothetical protein
VDKIREGMEDDPDQDRPPPDTLLRDTTCLIMEDDTMLIEIPYVMDLLFRQHLERLKQQERDL